MKLLVVEDDPNILSFLEKGLKEAGYIVDTAADGEDGLYLAATNRYDLLILDVMLPGKSGLDICKELRQGQMQMPIIMLTARNMIEDKVQGLDVGANDYLTKPFAFDELLARIRVQLRGQSLPDSKIAIADLVVDQAAKKVTRSGEEITLTLKEYQLLLFLIRHQNHIVSESMILEGLSEMDQSRMSNIVSVYIYRLRNKIDKAYDTKLIHTLRGRGYQFGVMDV